MQKELQIVWRHLVKSEAVERLVREKAAALEHYCSDIISCRVVIEESNHSHRHGNLYQVHVTMEVPGDTIVVGHTPSTQRQEDLYITVSDAFTAARRQLEDWLRVRRHEVKAHTAA